jgi:hypothetical protein
MKKIHRLVIAASLIVAVGIVALEVFVFHPSFNIGQYQVHLSGFRYMSVKSFGSFEGGNLVKGQVEKFTVHAVGPITIWARHD